ncbi:hypothetical protein DXV65_24510 [Pseudomonas fluorescens]|nr:hypothetical protein DXV65_24510 [Pseudomonas fluorescens]
MGAGLLAKAVDQPPSPATDQPPSRASPLPQWNCAIHRNQASPSKTAGVEPGTAFSPDTNQCGSWLACEGGGSAKSWLIDPPPSRASPLPQF